MELRRRTQDRPVDRRSFLRAGALGLGAAVAGLAPLPGRASPSRGADHAPGARPSAPWGRIEQVTEGVWALVSTPLADHPHARRTLCNGGIVAGREGVVVVEAFGSAEGATWMAEEAHRLTGRRPTHVVLTHHHGDHVSGAAGYLVAGARPALLATRTTRRLIVEQEAKLPDDRTEARGLLLPDVLVPENEPTELDLGDRVVRITPHRGHTPSDLAVEADGVVFAGDLVWKGMFPNYVDAIPTALEEQVRALRDRHADMYVSGHGELTAPDDLDRYLRLLDHVGRAAHRAIEAGQPLDEAGAAYDVPDGLGEWHMFSPRYPEVAFRAWARELEG